MFTSSGDLTRHKKICGGRKPTIICKGEKVKRMPSKSEKVFYGEGFSYDACEWLEHMSRETGRHIHHALCGHGGERVIRYGEKENEVYKRQTSDLTYISEHVPVSVAIHDSLNGDPTFLEHDDPKILVERFVEQLEKRHALIVKDVERMYPRPDDFDMLPDKTQKAWNEWVNQVVVIGFNSGKYDLNMIKRYFVDQIAKDDTPGMSYDLWCKSLDCKLEKLVFPYEWLTSYDKLNHVGPVEHKNFYSSLTGKNTLSLDEYETFRAEFYKRGCVTMMDWLREYNLADVEPFIEAVDKTRRQYYDDEIDILKGAVSIPGVSMRYVLNKSLRLNPKLELYAPGEPCKHKCNEDCFNSNAEHSSKKCKACKKVEKACTECTKNEAYELLQTGMVGGPAIMFCRYHERDVTGIRSHIYQEPRKCKTVLGLDANMLFPSTLMQDFPCGKEKLIKINPPTAEHNIRLLTEGVQSGSLFGFAQVDIEVPLELYDKFSEMAPLFVVKEIPDDQIPEHMHEYLKATGRKRISGTRKLLGLMKAEKILLYTPVLKWYLDHGLKVTTFHQFIKYKRGKPFAWFPEEIADARRQADKDPDKRIAGDTAKLKGNSFYGKMIEDLARHANTIFTRDEKKVDAAMRSPYLEDLEEIGAAYEIREGKKKVHIDRAYQCGIAVYQLAKLRMLEFYYDFIDNAYFAISGEELRDVVRPELLDEYDKDVKNWLVTDKYSSRTGSLFKLEFMGFRMIATTAKCYFVEGKEGTKFSCKGMSKKHNAMTWERYKNALNGSIDTAKNVGFRLRVTPLQYKAVVLKSIKSKYAKPAKQDSTEKHLGYGEPKVLSGILTESKTLWVQTTTTKTTTKTPEGSLARVLF
ncbi:uncharacterized protein LOC130613491 [Hydractinia symbiolongicarpus]|uniref:uncharacterized protein LOC130613491 n=1 Tax=Hydractinia symbiolongicarpus TaxID=13093 RepID=UPI00254F48B0|nr:uncharacterized protein LOC130613491 [Hydractinia symbiolongicarpus]